MRVYTCNDHDGVWPVGTASVVVARDRAHAKRLLDAVLIERGLQPSEQKAYTLVQLPLDEPRAVILVDGDY